MVHGGIKLRVLGMLLLGHLPFLFVLRELIAHLGEGFKGIELRSLVGVCEELSH